MPSQSQAPPTVTETMTFDPVTGSGTYETHYTPPPGNIAGETLCGKAYVIKPKGKWLRGTKRGARSCMACFRKHTQVSA